MSADSRQVALVYVRKSFVKAGQSDPASPELQARAAAERAVALGLTVEQHADADGHRSGKNGRRPGWQAVAGAFYARLVVSGETRCAFVEYEPREWCAAWA